MGSTLPKICIRSRGTICVNDSQAIYPYNVPPEHIADDSSEKEIGM